MTITTEIDVEIHPEDIAAEVAKWSDEDKRQFAIDCGLVTGEPTAFLPFEWPKRTEIAAAVERLLPDTPERPIKWWAEDIADAILGIRA